MQGKNNILRALFVGPVPPPYSGPEMVMQYFLNSTLTERLDIKLLKTNVRKDNTSKGRFDLTLVWAFFRYIFKLLQLCISHRPHVVFHSVTATRIGWLGRDIWTIAVSKLFGAKVVIHMQGGHFRYNFDRLTKIEQLVLGKIFGRSDLALVQARALGAQFKGIIPDERVKVLHNSLDTGQYQNPNLMDYDPNLILFLAFRSFAKGYCDLLKVVPRVAKRFPNVRFVLCGELLRKERNVFFNQATGESLSFEDPQDVYAEYIKGRFEKNVELPGVVHGEQKMELLRSCCLFTLPSYSEGFSMSILEAMSMGKPVVVTPVGSVPEIIEQGKHGLIVMPGDLDKLADAISTLLGDISLRGEMSKANEDYVRKMFDYESIASQLEAYLRQVTSRTS